MSLVRRILVPVDLSDSTDSVLNHAVYLAEKLGASAEVLNVVWEPPPYVGLEAMLLQLPRDQEPLADHLKRKAEEQLEACLGKLPGGWGQRMQQRCVFGSPATVISDLASDEGFDLIVMGTHGRSGLRRAVAGSVAEAVIRHAPCPVLTVGTSSQEGEGNHD